MGTNEERIRSLKEEQYKGLFGVTKTVFNSMVEVLNAEYKKQHALGGKPPKLSVTDRLVITLDYYKDYRPFDRIGYDYGVKGPAILKVIRWVEDTLIKDARFHLPSKKELRESNFEVILVDCTESPIQRPKKNSGNTTRARKNGTQSKH